MLKLHIWQLHLRKKQVLPSECLCNEATSLDFFVKLSKGCARFALKCTKRGCDTLRGPGAAGTEAASKGGGLGVCAWGLGSPAVHRRFGSDSGLVPSLALLGEDYHGCISSSDPGMHASRTGRRARKISHVSHCCDLENWGLQKLKSRANPNYSECSQSR